LTREYFNIFLTFGYINPSVNPLIYAARYDVFRRSLKQIMGRDTASQTTGATPASWVCRQS